MDPKIAQAINSICMVIIALFVILAYFNGWG